MTYCATHDLPYLCTPTVVSCLSSELFDSPKAAALCAQPPCFAYRSLSRELKSSEISALHSRGTHLPARSPQTASATAL